MSKKREDEKDAERLADLTDHTDDAGSGDTPPPPPPPTGPGTGGATHDPRDDEGGG